LPGCEFVSLQYGDVAAEVEAVSGELKRDIRLFSWEEVNDFEDLAGLIEALDIVVSVQNSVVHLSGALGKDCRALVPYSPEWRYGAESSSMPWYRSVEIRRQSEPEAWEPVIRDVAGFLRSLDRSSMRSPAAEHGDLLG